MAIFHEYLVSAGQQVSLAELKKNLIAEQADWVFNNDIYPLLSTPELNSYEHENAYQLLFEMINTGMSVKI